MYQLYYTKSGAAWSSRQLIWQSDMAIDPDKYGIYDMKCSLEVNKSGELKFVMTKGCSSYDLFSKERSVLTLLMDNTTIFRGVVKLIETDLFFQRTITANSDLIYLSDSVFEPHGEDIEEKPSARFKRIIDHHNVEMQGDPEKQIQVGNFTFENGNDDIEKYAKNGGYKDTMSQLQNDFKDFYGFYQIRYSSDFSQKWLDYTETTGKSTSQDIKFSVNIEEYTFKDTVDDLFTILIPVGSDNLNLYNQNAHRNVEIRMPDQSKRSIEVYIVDKYIKIVEGIKAYGYIYQAESFTVDSNNIGKSGSNGRVGGSGSSNPSTAPRTGYEYYSAYVATVPSETAGRNPAAEGLYYMKNGSYVRATESVPVVGRIYYSRARPTYYGVGSISGNPRSQGLYEYSNGVFTKTYDTQVVPGKTYYSPTSIGLVRPDQAMYAYQRVSVGNSDNPAAKGWYYVKDGVYVKATETSAVSGRFYYERVPNSGSSGGGSGSGSTYIPRVYPVKAGDNPAALGLLEKVAFTIEEYRPTGDTEVRYGKTYYK